MDDQHDIPSGGQAEHHTSAHIRETIREIRRHRQGTLLAGERPVTLKFVLHHQRNAIVAPLEEVLLAEHQFVLFAPDESQCTVQLLLDIKRDDNIERDGLADRWQACHGTPRGIWVCGEITAARRHETVLDLADIQLQNALRPVESPLLRALNADRAALARIARTQVGVEIEGPLAVGLDPDGIDIRAPFGIVRIEFDDGPLSPDLAGSRVHRLLRDAGSGDQTA